MLPAKSDRDFRNQEVLKLMFIILITTDYKSMPKCPICANDCIQCLEANI